ncbi:MAG: hypothetical protein IJC48_09120 [Clostridia bacterium]|nr:hypothetical protein [Clostridia bacterium]
MKKAVQWIIIGVVVIATAIFCWNRNNPESNEPVSVNIATCSLCIDGRNYSMDHVETVVRSWRDEEDLAVYDVVFENDSADLECVIGVIRERIGDGNYEYTVTASSIEIDGRSYYRGDIRGYGNMDFTYYMATEGSLSVGFSDPYHYRSSDVVRVVGYVDIYFDIYKD